MKKNLQGFKKQAVFIVLMMLFVSYLSTAQSIVVNSVSGPGCSSNAITVTFTTTSGNGQPSRYDTATTFTAYLSSATGNAPWTSVVSFTMPTTTFTTGNDGVTSGIAKVITLPAAAAGTGYKIAVGSSNPTYNASTGAGASPAFTISTTVAPGTVSANQTICSGTQPASLTLSGTTASVVRWERSTSAAFTSPTAIANTTTTLTGAVIGSLSATTYFRAVVSNGCVANSSAATITVNPGSVGGSVAGSTAVCATGDSGSVTLSGHTGAITKWQSATLANFSNAVDIANTTTSQSYLNLNTTTYYRAVITNGICAAANSAAATITVDAVPVGGTVSGSATVCTGINSGSLTLSGYSGTIVKWQSCDLSNFSAGVLDIPNTSTNLGFSNLSGTTYYRAVISSGVCNTVNSSVATVSVDAAPVGGTISGSTAVCTGLNSGSLTLSGYSGTIVKWQSCDLNDFSAGVLDIPNTSTNLGYANLSGTTYYRAVVSNGVCNPANSSVAAIIVDAAANGGNINGNASVCYANNSGSLTVSGFAGVITGWESSTDNFVTAGTPIVNLTNTLFYNNLTTTTYYRAVISGGACPSTYSPIGTVTVVNSTVWTGSNGTSWTDAANWSCGVVPTAILDVAIAATANQPVISGDINVKSLTMATGSSLVVTSGYNLTVINEIETQGTASLKVESNANLVQVNDVDNTGEITVERNSNPLMRLDYTMWSAPVTGPNLLPFSPATIVTRFYTYNPSLNIYSSVPSPSTTPFNEGTGYLIRMPDNHPTIPTIYPGVFTGEANNGDVIISVANNTYNAIGNPYPSTIDADTFISDNGISEALYFWRKTNNSATTSYATYTTAGGAGTGDNSGDPLGIVPNGVIQVGQGFIAKSTSAQLAFHNGMRITDNDDQFLRSTLVERNRIWLNLTNDAGIFSQTMVSYMTGATQEVDSAIDGHFFGDSDTALTSIIAGEEFSVQGRGLPFESADIVPLGFKTELASIYTIGIAQTDGLFGMGQAVYLRDNLLNVTHDLSAGGYSFASEAGVFNTRFEVVYQMPLGVMMPSFNDHSVVIYKQGEGFVINSGVSRMSNVQVFDIRGRLLVEQKEINGSSTKFTSGAASQVLIVKITSDTGAVVTKKVVDRVFSF